MNLCMMVVSTVHSLLFEFRVLPVGWVKRQKEMLHFPVELFLREVQRGQLVQLLPNRGCMALVNVVFRGVITHCTRCSAHACVACAPKPKPPFLRVLLCRTDCRKPNKEKNFKSLSVVVLCQAQFFVACVVFCGARERGAAAGRALDFRIYCRKLHYLSLVDIDEGSLTMSSSYGAELLRRQFIGKGEQSAIPQPSSVC